MNQTVVQLRRAREGGARSWCPRGWGWVCLSALLLWGDASAADKVTGVLLVRDALTAPNQPVRIEARLTQQGLLTDAPLGGEPLQLEIDGKPVATAMTGGDGKAYFEYTPKTRGISVATVSVKDSPRVDAAAGTATVFVWEHRRPILVVEVAALMVRTESPSTGLPPLPLGKGPEPLQSPLPDAAEELARLTQYYYNVLYLVLSERGSSRPERLQEVRKWLDTNKFPPGYLLGAAGSSAAVGALLDQLKQDGWTTLKSGVGRTRSFAEAFLERRMEVVMVPEPPKGELPRKAKAAADWKDVRKKL